MNKQEWRAIMSTERPYGILAEWEQARSFVDILHREPPLPASTELLAVQASIWSGEPGAEQSCLQLPYLKEFGGCFCLRRQDPGLYVRVARTGQSLCNLSPGFGVSGWQRFYSRSAFLRQQVVLLKIRVNF